MRDPIALGKKIKALRLKNDLSLRDLGAKSGVSYSFISSIENSRFNGSRETIISLSQSLDGADTDELLLLAGFSPEKDVDLKEKYEGLDEWQQKVLQTFEGLSIEDQRYFLDIVEKYKKK